MSTKYYTADGYRRAQKAPDYKKAGHFHACIFCGEPFTCYDEPCAIEASYSVCNHTTCVDAWEAPERKESD